MSRRIPNPGESKSKFITREFVKQVLPPIPTPGMNVPGGRDIQDNSIVLCTVPMSASITEIGPFKPVVVGINSIPIGPTTDGSHTNNATGFGTAYDETSLDVNLHNVIWGISQDFITQTNPGRVKMSGWSWLDVTGFESMLGNSFDIFNRKLIRCYGGRAEILHGQNIGNWALVNLVTPNRSWVGKTDSLGIGAGNVGNVELYEATGSLGGYSPTGIIIQCATFPNEIVGSKFVEVTIKTGRLHATELC